MFDLTLRTLKDEIDTLKRVLEMHDRIRAEVFGQPASPDLWEPMRTACPKKIDWQVFDHCAGFTRLYALYEQCITDLIKEFLQLLPKLYPAYANLPDQTRTQHRVAVGQILQKWSEDGPYRALTEIQIVRGLTDGLSAAQPYDLLADAFLIDPQNYRGEILRKLFKYLGFVDCWAAIKKYQPMLDLLRNERDATETPETILHDIVEYRNGASHSGVSSVVSLEELTSYARFILILAMALAEMLSKEVWRRRIAMNQTTKVATVLKVFGKAIGVRLEPGEVRCGEELIASRGNSVFAVTVQSIRKVSTQHDRFSTAAGEELGLVLSPNVRKATILYRMV